MADVMVIAGTADGRQIAYELCKAGFKVVATVTTRFGRELYEETDGLEIFEGKLTAEEMKALLRQAGARCLIDASHPYAQQASVNAMSACREAGIPYLRFERGESELPGGVLIRVRDVEAAAKKAADMEGNIFLTVGSNTLEVFVKNIPDYKERLYARVLPDSRVLAKCEGLGLTAANIIALKGPFSPEMNVEMLKYCNAKVLVTKDSGEAGGVAEKLEAAAKQGIPVIMVERPEIDYDEKVSNIGEVLDRVRAMWSRSYIG